jgi:hypothetical protein
MEPSVLVSLYAWEKTGPVSDLVKRMEAVVAIRRSRRKSAAFEPATDIGP